MVGLVIRFSFAVMIELHCLAAPVGERAWAKGNHRQPTTTHQKKLLLSCSSCDSLQNTGCPIKTRSAKPHRRAERVHEETYATAKARHVCGLLQTSKGKLTQAREQFGAALGILNQLGERLYAEHIERALADRKQ
jgi:hypothetical protein